MSLKYIKLYENFKNGTFIEINDTKNLISLFEEHIGDNVVAHYTCDECFDEQLTSEFEITQDTLFHIAKFNSLEIVCECTACGNEPTQIDISDIFGIDIL